MGVLRLDCIQAQSGHSMRFSTSKIFKVKVSLTVLANAHTHRLYSARAVHIRTKAGFLTTRNLKYWKTKSWYFVENTWHDQNVYNINLGYPKLQTPAFQGY